MRSVVIENRRNILSKIANTALLMSPLERSARFVQASWRRRLRTLHPDRFKERQQQQQRALLEGGNSDMSDVTSSPFVTVSVTSKKSRVSGGGGGKEESGGGGGSVEMTNIDVNAKVTSLCVGLSNVEIMTMWKELGHPIIRGMREQDPDLLDQARAAASAAAIAPAGGEGSEGSERSEGSGDSTTVITTTADNAAADAAADAAGAADASSGGGEESEKSTASELLRVSFMATWETIVLSLKANDNVIAFARLRNFSAGGRVEADGTLDIRVTTKEFVLDDVDPERPSVSFFLLLVVVFGAVVCCLLFVVCCLLFVVCSF